MPPRSSLSSVPIRLLADRRVGPRFGIRLQQKSIFNRPVHQHHHFQIVFFLAGASSQRIGLREHAVQRGTVLFMAPMTPHQSRFGESDNCYVLYFDFGFLRPGFAEADPQVGPALLPHAPELTPFIYQDLIDFHLPEELTVRLEDLCARMHAQARQGRLCSREVLRALLTLFLAEVTQWQEPRIRALMQQRASSGTSERHVKGVQKFIAEHHAEKLTLADAARVVCTSPNYLANLIKRETGRTFLELLTAKRLERASDMLAFTTERVSRIANACGFEDADYFSRRFRKVVGCSPLEFRSAHAIADVHRRPAR